MSENMNKDPRADELAIDEINDNRPQPGATEPAGVETIQPATAPVDPSEATGRGEGVGEAKEVEGKSQGQIVRERFFRHKGALFGIITLVVITLLSFSAMGLGPIPGWWRFQNPMQSGPVLNGGAPTLSWSGLGLHPFGQDEIGRDNFALVMKGVQSSLLVMIIMSVVAVFIGVTIGALSGYFRGKIDMTLMRFTDMVITLPVIVIGAVLGKIIATVPVKMGMSQDQVNEMYKSMPVFLAIALGCILWPGLARLTRSEFLSLREREFVDSARVAGASDRRIIVKHMLPNALGVVIVNTTLLMAASVVLETSLSYLGFGIREPSVSLGMLISSYQSAFNTRPWLFWWPGLFIILIALAVNFMGDGLRDAFDPRSKRIPSKRQMDKAVKKSAPSFEDEHGATVPATAGAAKEGSK